MPKHKALYSVDEVDDVDNVDRVNDGAMSTTSTTSTASTMRTSAGMMPPCAPILGSLTWSGPWNWTVGGGPCDTTNARETCVEPWRG